MFFISGAQNLNAPCDSFRATGPWFTQNYGRCDSISAPGFAEQTLPERILAVPLPKLRESVLETCRGGAEGESAEGREKPPWGVTLPRAGLGPAPTKRKDSYQPPESLPLGGKVPSECEADEGAGCHPLCRGGPMWPPVEVSAPCRARPPGRAAYICGPV